MTILELLRDMADIVERDVSAYATDLAHDTPVIRGMRLNDTILWGTRDSGTTLIVLERDGKPNKQAKTHYDAAPPHMWYLIVCDDKGQYRFSKCDNHPTMVHMIAARASNRPDAISELHM